MIPEKLFDSTANARTDPEWRRRSGEPNQPGEDFPHDLCLHQLFEVQAQRWPEAVAVTCEGDQLTYKELNARANHLAHFLRGLGVGPETLVGVCLERSLEMIVAVLGILKAGGAYVPLDPGYPPERLAFMLTDAAVMVAVTQRSLKVPIALGTTPLVYVEETKPGNARLASLNPRSGASPDNLAYVIYTSGSTGQPKGVMVTHRSVVELFRATDVRFHFGPQDVWTLFHSVSFDFSVWEIWGGALLEVAIPDGIEQNPEPGESDGFEPDAVGFPTVHRGGGEGRCPGAFASAPRHTRRGDLGSRQFEVVVRPARRPNTSVGQYVRHH
jgi:non-ribosomal peptide synthetase component F